MTSKPPPDGSLPVVHEITELYRMVYALGRTIPKRDRFGIHLKIEHLCFEILELALDAAFAPKPEKTIALGRIRIKLEVLKHAVRLAHELNIFTEKIYLDLIAKLITISKMVNGWIRYIST